MDVMRPPVIWINGRCYRKLPSERNRNSDSTPPSYSEQDMMYEDEICDGLIEETSKGFKTVLEDVPSILYKFIIGRGGESKKRIEEDTNTRISIPAQGQTGNIVIIGPHKDGVLSARSRVNVISESSRQKIPYTHFISFPLYFDSLAERAIEFKESVLQDLGQCKGIHPSIFQQPSRLHLTVGMLRLLNQSEVKLADSLVDRFVDQGLMQRGYDRVKLHATVMNSKLHSDLQIALAKADASRRKGPLPSRANFSFDVRDLVQLYNDFDFGTYQLKEIHLSKRGSFDSQGRYTSEISVPIQ